MEKKPYRFWSTWGRVNNDIIFIWCWHLLICPNLHGFQELTVFLHSRSFIGSHRHICPPDTYPPKLHTKGVQCFTTFIMIMIHSITCFLTNQTCWMSSMSLSMSMLALSLLMRLKIKGGGDSLLNTYSRRHVHVHHCKVLCMNQGCAINYRLIDSLQVGRFSTFTKALLSPPPQRGLFLVLLGAGSSLSYIGIQKVLSEWDDIVTEHGIELLGN